MRSCVEVSPDKAASLRRLREAIQTVTCGQRGGADTLSSGWREVDAALPGGGLAFSALHEWFGRARSEADQRRWTPPLSVLVHLAAQRAANGGSLHPPPVTLWIGQRVWPYGYALWRASRVLFASSIFVGARDAAERHWAMDVALRSAGAGTVIVADAGGMPLAMSRRLQLAAEAGGTLGLLARPLRDEAELSVAVTRWRVGPEPSHAASRRWRLELVRSKGGGAPLSSAQAWTLEGEDGRLVVVSPALADRPGASVLAS